jgi:hypothetical protein
MEFEEEVREALGSDVYDKVCQYMMEGHISMQNLKDISIKLHPRVHGEFKRRREEKVPVDVHELRRVLDDWWEFELNEMQNGCGHRKLCDILSHPFISLKTLVWHIEKIKPKEFLETVENNSTVSQQKNLQKNGNRLKIRTAIPIHCKNCSNVVGDKGNVFTMFDEPPPTRMFTNPHGYVHDVLTITHAQGIKLHAGNANT